MKHPRTITLPIYLAESREAMEAILASPEGKAAVEDVPNYATGGATFLYTDIEEII